MKKAQIYLKQKNQRIDNPYTYLVDDNAQIGQRVVTPFGKGDKLLEGIIVGFKEESDQKELKKIAYYIDEESLISPNQLKLNQYLKDNIFGLFYSNLNNFTSPIKTRSYKGSVKAFKPKKDYQITLKEIKEVRGTNQRKILKALEEHPLKFSELKQIVPKTNLKTLIRLQELGLIEFKEIGNEQVLDKIINQNFHSKYFYKFNQPENYNDFILNHIKDETGQVLIIFPNNFLAKQFYNNFSKVTNCSYYDPDFNNEENYNFYMGVRSGRIKIIISTFKGLFLNFHSLSSIFITYAGDENYYAGDANHFNVIETAEKLAEIENVPIYFLDFLNSILAENKIKTKEWELIESEPIEKPENINIEYIDATGEEGSIFSPNLKKTILDNLSLNKKTVLVMNRRGYFNTYICKKCGSPIKCPRCGSNLRTIKSGKEVECRLCSFTGKFPNECSKCGNNEFREIQYGLDRVIEEVRKIAPSAKIAPYFSNYKGNLKTADIIVGTSQLLYEPPVENTETLAVVLIDIDLNYPDYRSPETAYRFYSTLFNKYSDTKIIIQTQEYKNSFLNALLGEPETFFQEQSEYRKLVEVPPFSDIIQVTLTAQNVKIVNNDLKILSDRLKKLNKEIEILKAHALRRIKNVSQKQFFIKIKNSGNLLETIKEMYRTGEIESLDSRVSILVNPSKIL